MNWCKKNPPEKSEGGSSLISYNFSKLNFFVKGKKLKLKNIMIADKKLNEIKIGIMGVGMVGSALKNYFEKKGKKLGEDLFLYDPAKGFDSVEELNKADIIFVCVPTPYLKDGKGLALSSSAQLTASESKGPALSHSSGEGFDLSYIEDAFSKIEGEKAVVIKSTVLPGTTEKIQAKYPNLKVLFNPEFLTEITAEQDMNYPDRQIIGYTEKSFTVAKDIMMLLPLAPFERIMPATEAEMVKYFGNNWFSVKVAFANQMFDVCSKIGADYDTVMEAASADKRIGPSHLVVWHKGYRGYGGRCLPKDIRAFIQLADSLGIDLKVHKATEQVNNDLMKMQNIEDPEKYSKRE